MKKYPRFSIIIPLYVICNRFFSDLKKFQLLDYPNYEILVVTDRKDIKVNERNTKIIVTGETMTGPAEKRDIGLSVAKGDICAFIDDDAYPDKKWLSNAIDIFKDEKIAGVCGPGITPKEDGFWEQVTGLVYQSYFCGGPTQHRFTKAQSRYVNDFPAYNLLVRTKVLNEVGGYGSYYYGGEDTFLCLKIVKKGWKIRYDPSVVVYHHRRPLFFGFLRQISNIGEHRGFFVKKYPETSRHLTYFMPSFVLLSMIFLLLSYTFLPQTRSFVTLMVFLYFLVSFLSVIYKADAIKAFFAGWGIILTHLTYGIFFFKGLMTKSLKR